ncbi:Polysaccharide biosynthesis protein [Candidatus Bealeia paramacronuclearis]|uniref:Polysaccharide biosynthesis protein n=1 Tax=Candidatus Bealeia paramacronuclearis TaxID=1921001 RepID=A0ABZ2C1Z8_9PROT|nr:Polysaccharide biosynthesis protein [Candidatus Bealeia paramacronuclearis]
MSLTTAYLTAQYILQIPLTSHLAADLVFLFIFSIGTAYFLSLEKHLWRFTSLYSLIDVFKYCAIILILFVGWRYLKGEGLATLIKFSFLFLIFSFSALNMVRILIRLAFERLRHPQVQTGANTVIVLGAGKGAELFIRESMKRADSAYKIEGLLDDDPNLWGKKIFGIKIYGPIKDMAKFVDSSTIQMIVIAIPSLDQDKLCEIITTAEELGMPVKILPSFEKLLINKNISPEDISMEDLLGRDAIQLDDTEVSNFIKGKNILITGAGGSIGSEICRQLIKLKPKSMILVDHSEYNLYKMSWELEHVFKYTQFVAVLASVNDFEVMEGVFRTHNPNIVFHAAAYKHVPLLEKQAKQALRNNFFGTKNVAELASLYGSEKFILISTDKAVNPTNVMGSTKRMAEVFCQNFNQSSETNYSIVRFGNVLGSDGSVIPLFKKQLKQGGPLTVTHPEITRFFMSIPEASQLVIQAGAMGKGGEIFVLDMGSPIKITDLAERLISLSGKRPYKDIEIVFTGLRPGEKLYEELFYESEGHIPTKREKIFIAKCSNNDFKGFEERLQVLEKSINHFHEEKLIEIISHMVPEATIDFSPKAIYGVDGGSGSDAN